MKNIVLFINAMRPATFRALELQNETTGREFEPVILVDEKIADSIFKRNGQLPHLDKVRVIRADFDDVASVTKALKPIEDNIFAVTSQYENSVLELKKIVPHLPYCDMPTETSLEWATEKKLMRELMHAYDESLVPKFFEVHELSDKKLDEIEQQMSYPMIVKPSGLEGSLLVSMVNNKAELRERLEHGFSEVDKAYSIWIKRQRPFFLVEEFMQGQMYSIDVYADKQGGYTHTPIVKVITGKQIGFDDFFGFARITPADISADEEKQAQTAAENACTALGLRSVTVHVELMRTEDGWKIIELGPRIGGYRHDLYMRSFGINHIMNDITNRGGEPVFINREAKGHAALLNIYARSEGTFQDFSGLDTVKDLASFVEANQTLQPGAQLFFAKNNGDPVFEISLFNENYDKLLEDIATVDKTLTINVQ